MKTIIFLFITAFAFTHNTLSQWVYQVPPNNASYYITVEFPNALTGITGGVFLSSDFSGRGAYTTNSGTNWQASVVPDSLRVMAKVVFINSTTGFCAGAYNTVAPNYPVDPAKYDKRTLQLLKQDDFSMGNNYKGLFIKTTNIGQTWFTYGTLPANVFYLQGLSFVNSTTGFATASYNVSGGVDDGVIKTTNGGLNWVPLTMPEVLSSLNEIQFLDINTGYAVGFDEVSDTARGLIIKTTNAGVSWTRQVFLNSREMSGIDFSNASTGFAVSLVDPVISSAEGRVYKTTNAGINWNEILVIPDIELQGVNFVSGTGTALLYGTKYLPGFENIELIAKTTNYGNNWFYGVLNDTGMVLFDSKLIDANNWYLTGGDFNATNNPVILHTTNGGALAVTPISGEIPKSFSISQNYPNPFNPVTKIMFQIPLSRGVSVENGRGVFTNISVYDILGREVETLVNEQLSPGTYEVDFDASKLTSGIYFYKLTTDKFTETKRMVLVK